MTIVKIEPNPNGSHSNQTTSADIPVPKGWAVIPGPVEELENFPFGELEVGPDGTLRSWTPLPVPPAPEPTPNPENEKTVWEELDGAYREGVDGI